MKVQVPVGRLQASLPRVENDRWHAIVKRSARQRAMLSVMKQLLGRQAKRELDHPAVGGRIALHYSGVG